jgi:hypothetical protein
VVQEVVESRRPGEVIREQLVLATSQAVKFDNGHLRRSALMSIAMLGLALVGVAILVAGLVLLLVFGLKK